MLSHKVVMYLAVAARSESDSELQSLLRTRGVAAQ